MLPAAGCVTARAKPVATAASTAFPPCCKIDAPTSEAWDEVETTRPVADGTPKADSPEVGRAACPAAARTTADGEAMRHARTKTETGSRKNRGDGFIGGTSDSRSYSNSLSS
jgi:hypothetical protein